MGLRPQHFGKQYFPSCLHQKSILFTSNQIEGHTYRRNTPTSKQYILLLYVDLLGSNSNRFLHKSYKSIVTGCLVIPNNPIFVAKRLYLDSNEYQCYCLADFLISSYLAFLCCGPLWAKQQPIST